MEELIYKFFTLLDPTGANTAKYKAFFGKMTDEQFKSFFDKFFKDHSAYLTLDVEAYKNDLQMVNVYKAAKFLNVPLFETVMEPFFNKNDDPNSGKISASARKVPVGYIHMKPVQQMVRKKNHTSLSIDQRDPRTGQVSGDDRTVQFSIDENYGLMAHNAKSLLKEFMSVRADDMVMKQEAYADIRKNGYDLSINKYKEVEYKKVEFEPVKNILRRLEDTEGTFLKGYRELSKMLEKE